MIKIRSNHLFLFLYILFIVYGSLFPLVGWRPPTQSLLEVWLQTLGDHVSRSDLVTNLLVYIPLGILLSSVLSGKSGRILLTVFWGSLLSFSMEYLQLFLPARTSSPIDLMLNILSTLSGALSFSWFGRESSVSEWINRWRQNDFKDGKVADIGIFIIVLWGAAQLAPFVPSLDVGDLKNGLKPLWITLHDLPRLNGYLIVTYALYISSLGAVLHVILKNRAKVPVFLCFYCGAVLFMKITIVGRGLSLEDLIGLFAGVLFAIGFRSLPRSKIVLAGISFISVAFIANELRPDVTAADLHGFNWIPFNSQMAENVSGIGNIIDGLWPFAAIGFFTVAYDSFGHKTNRILIGTFLAIGVIVLEYAQSFIAGRYPDITSVILAVFGWYIPLIIFIK